MRVILIEHDQKDIDSAIETFPNHQVIKYETRREGEMIESGNNVVLVIPSLKHYSDDMLHICTSKTRWDILLLSPYMPVAEEKYQCGPFGRFIPTPWPFGWPALINLTRVTSLRYALMVIRVEKDFPEYEYYLPPYHCVNGLDYREDYKERGRVWVLEQVAKAWQERSHVINSTRFLIVEQNIPGAKKWGDYLPPELISR